MSKKLKSTDKQVNKLEEPTAAYRNTSPLPEGNPNVPFHGTQQEWWEHIHHIEDGEFIPNAVTSQPKTGYIEILSWILI
ncbi:hypothetical protein [Limibacterium fermenti]|uniref:hypothetical protein n=1 Tax=Limibacterium fermenti TaxID=3229863 RepID=UPI000E88BD15|nr:hypothetical protein [Porphyromonadaceae bacterium]HBX45130.1 hypothetical protein [Porphyromonadaceae bacterium]